MKNKKTFKLFSLLFAFVFATVISFCGFLPLYNQVKVHNNAQKMLDNTGSRFYTHSIKTFELLKTDIDKLEDLKNELSKTEGYLGIYKYPDTNVVSTVRFGDNYSDCIENSNSINGNKGFLVYEYNEGLNDLELLKVKEGQMFEFKTYKTTETVPVVVTENDYFKIGDKIKLDLNVTNYDDIKFANNEPISVDAVVCGVVEKDVYLPALYQQKFSGIKYFSELNDLVWIFTPDLSEYTKLFDYQPEFDRGESLRFYALYEGGNSECQKIINKYGFYDVEETTNTLGWDLQREIFSFRESKIEFAMVALSLLYFAVTVFFIKAIVKSFCQIRKNLYD